MDDNDHETELDGVEEGTNDLQREISTTSASFNRLPIELRLKIWKTVAFMQRNVVISIDTIYCSPLMETDRMHECPYCFTSTSPAPEILHICKESRAEGLKHYTLDFAISRPIKATIRDRNRVFQFSSPAEIYFNWEVDRVCIPSIWALNWDSFLDSQYGRVRCNSVFQFFHDRGLKYLALNVWGGQEDFESVLGFYELVLEDTILFFYEDVESQKIKSCKFVDAKDEDRNIWSQDQLDLYQEEFLDQPPIPNCRICEIHDVKLGPVHTHDTY